MSRALIYLGNDLLDFNEQVNVKRQVNDWRDPSLGGNITSFTLDIPLTSNNRKLLGFIDDVRSREEVSAEGRIVVNGMEIIRGKFRILRVIGQAVRSIIEGTDWLSDIAGISIRDLSWVGGDGHTFTGPNVENSWSAGAGAFYRYPLINFATLYSEENEDGAAMYPYDFYPMWNIEDIVTKILIDAGYTLAASGFFAGAFGQALYILSSPTAKEQDFIAGKGFHAYVTTNAANEDEDLGVAHTGAFSLTVNQVLVMVGEIEDEGADYNTGTYEYTAPEDGTYRFQAQIKVFSDGNDAGANADIDTNSITWSIRKNGTPLESFVDSEADPPEPTLFDSQPVFTLDTGWVFLEAGDDIDVHVNIFVDGTNQSGGPADFHLYVVNGSTNSFLLATWDERNLWLGVGETISPSTILPNIDSVEFLKGLKEFANLRFFVDRNNRTIYIETSDDFYGSTVIDWTDKIDYSDPVELEVIASNYKKNQQFKYKPDTTDKAYTDEVAANGVPFVKDLVIDSEYVKAGTEERENSIFSPTILGNMNQLLHYDGKVPKILGGEEFVAGNKPYPAYRSKQWGVRILEWKGLIALTSGSYDYYEDIEDASATTYTTFPSVETPDMDDMYNDYLLKDWNRIEKNKIVTCTLKLNPTEIMKFMTVVSTAANEGFRATYNLNIEGVDMYFLVASIVTDGDRVKAELIQKL